RDPSDCVEGPTGRAAIEDLHSSVPEHARRGVLVFAAAGNDSELPDRIAPVARPANCPPAIAVTSTDANDRLAPMANTGPEVALTAPGVDIVTIGPDGNYRVGSGGSFATAIAASVAALVFSVRPDLSADDVETILRQSAKKLDLGAYKVGAGRVDALAAIRLAKTYRSAK